MFYKIIKSVTLYSYILLRKKMVTCSEKMPWPIVFAEGSNYTYNKFV